MARDLNIWHGTGRLGKAPELRYTQGGKAVCSIAMACGFDGKVEWVNLVFWEKLAEIVGKYCDKGSFILVTGRLQTQKYDKDGQTHYKTEIIAQNMQMLSKKEGGDDGQSSRSDYQDPADLPPVAQRQVEYAGPGSDYQPIDDDIPF